MGQPWRLSRRNASSPINHAGKTAKVQGTHISVMETISTKRMRLR